MTKVKFLVVFISFVRIIFAFHMNIIHKDYVELDGNKINNCDIHNELRDHEKLFLFGNLTHRPDVKFVHVTRNNHYRSKRSTDGLVSVRLEDDNEQVDLKLQQTHKLIDDAFILIRRYENSSQFIADSHRLASEYEKCFYRNEYSALDLCDDSIRGIIHHNSTEFLIHPLPERFGRNSHIIFKSRNIFNGYEDKQRQEVNDIGFEPNLYAFNETRLNEQGSLHISRGSEQSGVNGTASTSVINNASQTSENTDDQRKKRHISTQWKIPHVLHIETAVFIDRDLFKHMSLNFPVNTENHLIRFILAMVNGVQLLYHHPSLGHQINFVLKRLEILHSDPSDLRRSSDIDIFLNNFCLWQKKFNPASDTDVVHYDHAVILTGLDLYVVSKNGKVSSQVVGLAPVAGMCTATSSCTINEGKHFESVFVVAHEIGHNLGMRHDTSENNCDPSLYIMSPTLGSGKITWSKCSRSYLNAFLETTQAQCMFDRGKFGNNLDHSAEGILPGERFDADQQCMLKYGKDSIRSRAQEFADICRDLHCQRERYTWTSHPALEGTECGDGMWCRSGVCVLKGVDDEPYSTPKHMMVYKQPADKVSFVDDKKFGNLRHEYNFNKLPTWSEWGQPSECDSGCLYGDSGRLREGSTGLRTYIRSCLDYRKRCVGRDRKYESCIAKQCFSVTKTTVEEFATQICERAKKFDMDLTGEGLQVLGDSDEDSCKVFCVMKNNGTRSRSWTFPDGTTCHTNEYDFDDASYCVNGRCEKFSCENSSKNYFKMDSKFCPQSLIRPEVQTQANFDQQDNNLEYRNAKGTSPKPAFSTDYPVQNVETISNIRKTDTFHQWKYSGSERRSRLENMWLVKSGCHFSCMDRGKGLQVISSRIDDMNNIQLCSPKLNPCDKLTTPNEFAENLCTRYKLKVHGLSGFGMQIAPSAHDPDRSCRVACQDEYLLHRFYLVNGDHGLFPFGTKCSFNEERYCVNGKCLEFGPDNIPLMRSYISLALFRTRRDLSPVSRTKRNYLYYKPINITEQLTQQLLDKIVRNIDFNSKPFLVTDQQLSNDHIEFNSPIHISFDEII